MKAIILIICLLTSINSNANYKVNSKVVLITSLKEMANITFQNNRDLENDLEKYFRLSFENSGFDIKIFHSATPTILLNVLTDPRVSGVFWVSHSRKSRTYGKGIGITPKIVDAFSNDVKNIFQFAHPKLKFLGLIGCETHEYVEELKQKGHFKSTTVSSFNSWTGAKSGMRKALLDAYFPLSEIIRNETNEEMIQNELGQLWYRVPRLLYRDRSFNFNENKISDQIIIEVDHSPVFQNVVLEVTMDKQFLGLVTLSPDQNSTTFAIPTQKWTKSKRKNIKFRLLASDLNDDSEFPEDLRLTEHQPKGFTSTWSLFENQKGQAIGLNSRLYIYKQ